MMIRSARSTKKGFARTRRSCAWPGAAALAAASLVAPAAAQVGVEQIAGPPRAEVGQIARPGGAGVGQISGGGGAFVGQLPPDARAPRVAPRPQRAAAPRQPAPSPAPAVQVVVVPSELLDYAAAGPGSLAVPVAALPPRLPSVGRGTQPAPAPAPEPERQAQTPAPPAAPEPEPAEDVAGVVVPGTPPTEQGPTVLPDVGGGTTDFD